MAKTSYDIVVVVDGGESQGTHVYEKRRSETVVQILEAMDKDRVFGLFDNEMRVNFFKPNEVSKLQFNLRESWVRS